MARRYGQGSAREKDTTLNERFPGFDSWFEDHMNGPHARDFLPARVSAVDRNSYMVRDESGETSAELSGKLAFQIRGPEDLPCVGDWVLARRHDGHAAAIIHGVLPRRTFLRRKSAGPGGGCQMIAANVDAAFLVQSCHYDFNRNRLERYLVMAADGNVEPVVLLTKTDLVTPEELELKVAQVQAMTKARVIALSTLTGSGLLAMQQALSPGMTYCLLGSSGVGKTTLLNSLMGKETFLTRSVSGTGEGTHTTTRRQLVVLEQGSLLIDTPGMRELGLADAADGVDTSFEDIAALAQQCRYADCSHQNEPGCAVRAALEAGQLREARFANYMKLKKETEHYARSYAEKRKKDKDFGKFVKSVKKHMKR